MEINKEKILIATVLLCSVIIFFVFGFFHLTKFETTDEHLWKYGRIKQYWQAVENQDWVKTYINDKPGVTVALISGIGLFFEPSPENHKISDPALTQNGLFELYNVQESERINMVFRLPILIFSALSLFIFFWLIFKAFDSKWLALISTIFIATNPILIGMSQIINPDSFFWIFGGLSVFSFLALLRTNEKKFLILTGILTGFALLSKYTSATLFIFFVLAILAKIIFPEKESKENCKFFFKKILDLLIIFILSLSVFSIFLPAVFEKPEYLFKGISQFLDFESLSLMIFFFISLTIIAFWKKKLIEEKIVDFFVKKNKVFLTIIAAIFLVLMTLLFVNIWTNQHFAPLDEMKDTAYAKEPKQFNFGSLVKYDNFIEKNAKLFLMEMYPFVFSLTPLSLFLIFFLVARIFQKKSGNMASRTFFVVIVFFLIYFYLTISAKVVSNARYSILLYPLFSFLSAVCLLEFLKFLKLNQRKNFLIVAIIILTISSLALWKIRPFYFSYSNFLLPEKFTIHHSWGHGAYEAATYLNSLPNSEQLIIRSSTNTICPFLKGKCLKSRKIDLNKVTPDYFLITRRGELKERDHFVFINSSENTSNYYYENIKNNYLWSIHPGNHENNYLKLVKFEK